MKKKKNKNRNNIHVIIAAAGNSSRMADFKPLLSIGDCCMIERTINNFKIAGLESITVVTGHRREELLPVLYRTRVHEAVNDQFEYMDMFFSILVGLKSVSEDYGAVLICPADMPLIRPFTIQQLVHEWESFGDPVLIPTYFGKEGHPLLLSKSIIPSLFNYHGSKGLRGALNQLEENIRFLELPDSGMTKDADFRADYLKLLEAYLLRNYPDVKLCESIWNFSDTPEKVREHCYAVTKLAKNICNAVNEAWESQNIQRRLNVRLVESAALLHDVLRTKPNHAAAGARLLSDMGYEEVAKIVECHQQIQADNFEDVNESTLVFLADKLVIDADRCTLFQRYERSVLRVGDQVDMIDKINKTYTSTKRIYCMFEQIIGSHILGLSLCEGMV